MQRAFVSKELRHYYEINQGKNYGRANRKIEAQSSRSLLFK